MKKIYIIAGVCVLFIPLAVFGQQLSLKERWATVKYPIAELGKCASKNECKKYCDVPAHMSACLTFAEQKSLMASEDIVQSRAVAKIILKGGTPGNCQSLEACSTYCDSHVDECIEYAVKNDLVPGQMKKLLPLLKTGGPGGCKIGEECERYCSEPAHQQECINFSIEKGLIDAEEARAISGELPSQEPFSQFPAQARAKLNACVNGKIGAERFRAIFKDPSKETSADQAAITACIESVFELQ